MDSLLARLSEQQTALAKQKSALSPTPDVNGESEEAKQTKNDKQPKDDSSISSTLITPASGSLPRSSPPSEDENTIKIGAAEMTRLKKELDAAKNQIARQKQELDQTRVIKHTFDQALGPSPDKVVNPRSNVTTFANTTVNPGRSFNQNHGNIDDLVSDGSDQAGPYSSFPNMWSATSRPVLSAGQQTEPGWGQLAPRSFNQRGLGSVLPTMMPPPQQPVQARNYSMPVSPVRGNGRGMDLGQYGHGRGFGTGNPARHSSLLQRGNGWDVYAGGPGPMDDMNVSGMTASAYQPVGMYSQSYQPQPIGTPLSPTAPEFRGGGQASANPWNNVVSHTPLTSLWSPFRYLTMYQTPSSPGQTYVSPMEPLNYRRLLDRSVTCNWKYIVDKIVCNNDQQASIFLQQKLKVGTVEQKFEIIEAIVAQAYPLMVNRFGNFLVQRCFEHGTPDQVIAIADAIRGNTLSLSMDAFGCHVVQKAFDAVPENYKAIMVHELLRRIPETVIHRYACHVWQKLFELRWSDSPPQIMKFVNEALCGMWHEVALGETGSLVVQNIFENCLEEDKVRNSL